MKAQPECTPVSVEAKVVSASFTGFFYIESDDRACGIRVDKANHGLAAGMRADVTGNVQTNADGERFISAAAAMQNGTGSVKPVGLCNRYVGGGDQGLQPGVFGSMGLNNIGLLVKTWGCVTLSGRGWFYMDDGSGVEDGSGFVGVYVDAYGMNAPALGSYVAVAGVSSCEILDGKAVNVLRPRSQPDIVVAFQPLGRSLDASGESPSDPRGATGAR